MASTTDQPMDIKKLWNDIRKVIGQLCIVEKNRATTDDPKIIRVYMREIGELDGELKALGEIVGETISHEDLKDAVRTINVNLTRYNKMVGKYSSVEPAEANNLPFEEYVFAGGIEDSLNFYTKAFEEATKLWEFLTAIIEERYPTISTADAWAVWSEGWAKAEAEAEAVAAAEAAALDMAEELAMAYAHSMASSDYCIGAPC
jgi:hypothetical protein